MNCLLQARTSVFAHQALASAGPEKDRIGRRFIRNLAGQAGAPKTDLAGVVNRLDAGRRSIAAMKTIPPLRVRSSGKRNLPWSSLTADGAGNRAGGRRGFAP